MFKTDIANRILEQSEIEDFCREFGNYFQMILDRIIKNT